jgi:hypothetical protein
MSTSNQPRDCSRYFDAIREAEEDVSDALGHIRAEENAGRITTVEAATERTRHQPGCPPRRREKRREHRAKVDAALARRGILPPTR